MHRIPELLAPAGGPEPFAAALAAGADAIYCGLGGDFNARRGARNFDDESFAAACRAAHVAGARVYVTENVVVRDEEMPAALALVRRAATLGADAFIIQDWGLLARIRRTWPELECHVSTQANVHDSRGVAWCRDRFGAARVTLSRELSLPEISTIAGEGVDLEVFGHGALCFCYSGVCLLSSLEGGRSANRGLCAQPCRLPYDLVDEDGRVIGAAGRTRPLCPKDACTIDDLPALVAAGVASLKVEGRMKAPDYVYSVVSTYRAQLDDLAGGVTPPPEVAAERARRLKRAFNRDFTDAYLRGTSGDELMSYERSNNRGELVGEVSSSAGRTARIRLAAPVGAGDLLELRPDDDPASFLTTHAEADARPGEVIACAVARPMPAGCPVRVIRSASALAEASRAVSGTEVRRREVRVRIVARIGSPFEVTLATTDGAASATARGFVVDPARTRAVTEEDLTAHVGRMGSTPFEPVSFEVELDPGCGMGFSAVHAVRAEAAVALERAILAPYEERAASLAAAPTTVDEADAAPAVLAGVTGAGAWPRDCVPVLDEVCRELDHARLDPWVRSGEPVAVGNVSELALAAERGASPEVRGCVPVHNRAALAALERSGAAGFWLSPELTLEEVELLAPLAKVPVGLVVSGRPRAMTSEHCVLQTADACIHDCARCALRPRRLSLRDRDGSLLPVRTDLEGRSRIYDAHPLDATPQIPALLSAGVTRFAVDATLLSAGEAAAAVARAVRALDAARDGRQPSPRLAGATSGHLFLGIG